MLELRWRQRSRWGWFLRAEAYCGMASHIHSDTDVDEGVKVLVPDLHNRSRGHVLPVGPRRQLVDATGHRRAVERAAMQARGANGCD
jgi:predicted ATPase